MSLKAAYRPAAAVQVDDKRRAPGDGAIQTRRDLADPQLAHRMHLRPARALPGALRDPFTHRSHIEPGQRRRHLRHKRGQLLIGKQSRHAPMLPTRAFQDPALEGQPLDAPERRRS